MWRHIKTWTIVICVTVLIWVFAEAESLRTLSIPTAITIRPPTDVMQVVEVIDDAGQLIADGGTSRRRTVAIEGPAAAITRAELILRDGITLNPGMSDQFTSIRGTRELDLAAVLRTHPALRGLGVTIKSVEPSRVRVVVDDLVEKRIPVVIELPEGQTDGPPVLNPTEVVIRVPSEFASRLDEGTPQAIAKIDRAIWDRLVPGRRETINVTLLAPKSLDGIRSMTFTPGRAAVELTVRSRTDTHVIATVPVHIRAPAAELERWDVKIVGKTLLNDVKVTGPADVIQRIREGAITIVAYVPLSFEDLEKKISSKEAVFSDLPTQLRFEPERPLIELEITSREVKAGVTP